LLFVNISILCCFVDCLKYVQRSGSECFPPCRLEWNQSRPIFGPRWWVSSLPSCLLRCPVVVTTSSFLKGRRFLRALSSFPTLFPSLIFLRFLLLFPTPIFFLFLILPIRGCCLIDSVLPAVTICLILCGTSDRLTDFFVPILSRFRLSM